MIDGLSLKRRCGAFALLVLLGGCGALPRPGDTVNMQVRGALNMQAFSDTPAVAAARPALQRAGIGPDEIAAGRVLRVHCALTTDGWWESLAVLPPGLQADRQHVVQVRVLESGENQRLPVNEVVALADPRLGPGGAAYRVIPDWREQGLSRNFERQPPSGGPAAAYLVVLGSWVVRCQP